MKNPETDTGARPLINFDGERALELLREGSSDAGGQFSNGRGEAISHIVDGRGKLEPSTERRDSRPGRSSGLRTRAVLKPQEKLQLLAHTSTDW